MTSLTRRQSLRLVVAGFGAATFQDPFFNCSAAEPPPNRGKIGLGFSLYGMPGLPVEQALRLCSQIGYDDVELSLLPDSPTEPSALGPSQRADLKALLGTLNLRLAALMVNLPLLVEGAARQANLDRLQAAAELAHALAPDSPPVIETVLGGKPSDWPDVRDRMLDRLRDWAAVGQSTRTVVAIKAHVNNALHTPEDERQLVQALNSPWLKLVFDYSHFVMLPTGLEKSLDLLLPDTAFIHVKDRAPDPKRVQFLLPGEGSTDYAEYFRLLDRRGYRGSVTVETSAQIFKQPGYDAERAARQCFAHLSAAMTQAGLR
ncbi:MAG TPA: sugar phosphate isomerase/epimerase [Pirellulales bacterium]|nr:sugar phosphate isomerase/epimerase [Pirellulales bacterium]